MRSLRYKLDRPSDSPSPFNGIFTLEGLSARNDHYELWINAHRAAYTDVGGQKGTNVRICTELSKLSRKSSKTERDTYDTLCIG